MIVWQDIWAIHFFIFKNRTSSACQTMLDFVWHTNEVKLTLSMSDEIRVAVTPLPYKLLPSPLTKPCTPFLFIYLPPPYGPLIPFPSHKFLPAPLLWSPLLKLFLSYCFIRLRDHWPIIHLLLFLLVLLVTMFLYTIN